MIKEIKYVNTDTLIGLTSLVNEAIAEGWQPHGHVVMCERSSYILFVQAMKKEEETPRKSITDLEASAH